MISIQGGMSHIISALGHHLLYDSLEVDVGEWHAQDISGQGHLITYELQNVVFETDLPWSAQDAVMMIEPNMPWAEQHFAERVSGEPLNPPPSAGQWGAVMDKSVVNKHLKIYSGSSEPKYSHTYPERFWPKDAGVKLPPRGIRFPYGDLNDVVEMLIRNKHTRQAYLPVWFPEDTGGVHRERLPCSLGYHFLIRENALDVTYLIRSVDFVRHFRDDLYLACRLGQWMTEAVNAALGDEDTPHPIAPGNITMHIMSLHMFAGDRRRMEREYGDRTHK